MEPEQAARILIGPAKNKFFYDWNEEYEAWLGTRAMDGARDKETTMLVIVPKDKAYIAVNIQREGWKTVAQFSHAVSQGTHVFLTYDANFASQGRHKWLSNKNWRGDGSPQWEDKNWKFYTSVEETVPLRHFSRIEDDVQRLQIEDGGASAQSEHHDNAKVRRLE